MPLGAARISFLAKTQVTAVAEVIRKKVGVGALGSAQIDTAQSKFGGASALFDGTGDYLQIADNDNWDLTSTAWTIEGWIRSDTVSGGIKTVIGKRSNAVTSGWFIYINNSDFVFNAIGITTIATASAAISVNTWHHFAVTRDGNDYEIFIDGTSSATTTDSSTIITNSEDLLIGRDITNTGRDWDGYIDELRISDTVRYTTGFTAPTAPFVNDDNTLLLLHMDGTDASTYFEDDNGVRAPVGVNAVGDAQVDTAISKFGGASALFDGASDYLEVNGTNSDWNVVVGEPRTFECWVYSDDINDQVDTIMGQRTTGAGTVGWRLAMQDSGGTDGELRLVHWNSSNAVTVDVYSTNTLSATTWHHVAYVWDGVDNHSVYIDGTRGINVTETDIASADRPLRIGNEFDTIGTRGWDGNIDEVRVSNVARYSGASFTAPSAPFVNDDNTLLLLHMDGTDASTDFPDDNGVAIASSTGRTAIGYTASGDAVISTTESKFGGSSLYTNSGATATQIVSDSNYTFGTGDFTIEAWVYLEDDANGYVWAHGTSFSDASNIRLLNIASTDKWQLRLGATNYDPSATVSFNTWTHLAVVRSSGTVNFYVDGVKDTTIGSSGDVSFSTNLAARPMALANLSYAAVAPWQGYIDEFRISDVARYSSNFTPSTSAFVDDANTLTLLHMDGTDASTDFPDDNGNGRSRIGVSAIGNAQIDTAQSKFGGASLLVNNTSYLNTNQAISIPTTGNWTVEMWVYFDDTTLAGLQTFFDTRPTSTNGAYITLFLENGELKFYHLTGRRITEADPGAITSDTWHHIALSRSGNDHKMFIDGTQVGSTYTNASTYVDNRIILGSDGFQTLGNGVNSFVGNMDEVRVSNTARYTSNFTAPTAPFQNDANTLLLLHCDGTDGSTAFIDDNGTYTE